MEAKGGVQWSVAPRGSWVQIAPLLIALPASLGIGDLGGRGPWPEDK